MRLPFLYCTLLATLLTVSGCSQRQVYDAGLGWRQQQCYQLIDKREQEQCLELARKRYSEQKSAE
ncbi:hypothetical protein [Vibrio sp.]|uniref:hypothetical protein n=1 Tax=Vibrio sp. TaxID=678 RepID=UPI003D12E073